MELRRFTRMNTTFMKNLPPIILSELIVFEEVIPDGIMSAIMHQNPIYKKERSNFLNYRPDLLEKIYVARGNRKRLAERQNSINIGTDENIEFIKKYPQYKQLIESIVYRDDKRNIVKVVPIDQYLAEN